MDAPRHSNAGKTIHPTIYVVINLFTAQGYQPTIHRCAPQPGRPPRMRRSFGRPCRCAREAGAHAARARARGRARARCPLPCLPDSVDSAPAARRDATCAGHRQVRGRRLACLADGLCVAPLVQAAAAARGRARRPPRPRHLRHDRQARRRHHGHEDPATVTPVGSAAGAKPMPVKPVKTVSRARSSSRLRPRRRTARPARPPSRAAPSTPSWSSAPCEPWRCHAGAASRHGSTTSPPLARRQPKLIRVALTRIYTARTTHSRHRNVTACHSQPASTPPPVPQLTRFSCLRAALARHDLLVAHRGRRDPWFVLPAS
jgi:hypothetical protein